MSLYYRRLLLAVVLVVHLVVLYSPSLPSPGPAGVPGADKVGHAAVFGLLVLAALWAGFSARWVVPLALAHAVLSEVGQHLLLAGRSGDPWDAVADVVGVGLGWGAAVWLSRRSGWQPPSDPDR